MFKKSLCSISLAFSLILLSGASVLAQTVRLGGVTGIILDESGAAVPGVTATLSGPALQVPEVIAVSDGHGEYQFRDLPPGTFRISYELQGFAKLVREGIVLTTGFEARIDATMKLATQTETITVTGQSPVVDVTNTRGGATVSQELLTALPNAGTYQDTLLLIPGASLSGPPLNGETGFRGNTGTFKSYGLAGHITQTIEGITMEGANEQPDFVAAQEVDAKTFGNTAEISYPGAVTQIIIRSGGNQFSGRYSINGLNENMQSSNIDDALRAQGVTQGDAPLNYWMATADIGGRIVPNKVWFYTAINELENLRTAPGYSMNSGADHIYGTPDDEPGRIPGVQRDGLIKGSYQLSPKDRLVAFYSYNLQVEPQVLASRLNPYEATTHFTEATRHRKIEWQGTLNDRMVADLMFGGNAYRVDYYNNSDFPTTLNLNTGLATGGSWQSYSNIARIPNRNQLTGSVSYFPKRDFAGSHQIKSGFNMWWGSNEISTYIPASGPYQQILDTISGVPNTGVQLQTRNYPTDGLAGYDTFGTFVSDTWRPTRRLTLNLGLRAERQWAWVPAQTKEQGVFGTSGSFPALDAGAWTTLAPRVGAAFDINGDGRTVVKGTYGEYYFNQAGPHSDFAQAYNQNTVVTTTYRWHDLNVDRLYQPGEVNLDVNGPDFLSVAGASNNVLNPALNIPRQREFTASIERDLGENMSIRGLYVYKGAFGQSQNVNILRPFSAWNHVYNRRDPGPDGVLGNPDDGGVVTIYDFDPAYAGSKFVANQLQNSSNTDTFNSYEVSVNRRKLGKWYATSSFVGTKNHRYIILTPQSPNDQVFSVDNTWDLSFRLGAGYELPYGMQISTLTQVYNGLPGQRTVLFRSADPDKGPSFVSSSSITMPVEEFGASVGPVREVVNLRLSKELGLGGTRRLQLTADGTNILNGNVPWGSPTSGNGNGQIYASGPTYGYVTRIQQPRALRLGAALSF